jgi:acyl-coenzyme A synthetase/AMP-(fatty) acid ligase
LALTRVPQPDDRLEGGAFRSADLGAWTDRGELSLLGRADSLINVGGKKVHPAEVERILRAMPGVTDAVVVGVASRGDERGIVRAFVACDPAKVSYGDVAAWCRERLAGHKVPRSIVRLAEIPRTSRGKIDRAALASLDPVER